MNHEKKIVIISVLFLFSCSSYDRSKFNYRNNDKEVWINTFKTEVFYSCMNEGIGNDSLIKILKSKDLLNIYDGFPIEVIDSARNIGKKIILEMPKPFIKIDNDEDQLRNKNFISYSCLNFYASRELDAIARKEYEIYLRKQKG